MLITIEGIDRAGKSTQAALLAEALGERALLVREPGGTEAGERMRGLLKDADLELDPRAELLLFCAARAELVARVIEPALAEGRVVICDRFYDSTIAYQGAGRGLGEELARAACELAIAGRRPDLTVLLWIDPGGAAARGQGRLAAGEADGDDRFEAEGLAFQRRVADAYERIAVAEPERVVRVDAEGQPAEVAARVLALVEERLR